MSATPILQFGTSRFLQAHADLFVSEALGRDEAIGRIAVVQSSGDQARRARLAALAAPEGFLVRIEGLEHGVPVRREQRVTSVAKALDSAEDWPEISRIAVEEAEVIISNTGDAGWKPQPQDASKVFDQAMSYPGKLTQLLKARFAAGRRGLTVLPCELVARNGDCLRDRVLALAQATNDRDFTDWIDAEIVFGNSLVDRIVSEPLEPAGAVAEPYALWAIEAQDGLTLPCRHASIQLLASLDRIENLKLHILNLGHTYLVHRWLDSGRAGAPLVRECLADPAMRDDLASLYALEVIPVFEAAGYGDEARAYVETTMDRFANPHLGHKLSDIAQNHAEKTDRRIGAFLDWGRILHVRSSQPRLNAAAGRAL